MVTKTMQSRGWLTGVDAAVLGGVSRIQTALSGFDPGLEFITAIEYVMEQNRTGSGGVRPDTSNNTRSGKRSCDLVLADQSVDETLRRVGSLPSESWKMWLDFWDGGGRGKSEFSGRCTESVSVDRFNWE